MPPSRTDWITNEIRNAILHGDFAPGEQLRSSKIGERWSISQTPIREAFQRLAAEGLVVHSSQRGVRVAPLSMQDMREVYELRLLLEPMALRRSLERADQPWEVQVRRAFSDLLAWYSLGAGDLSGYESPHRRFHAALASRCDSQWLLRLVDMLAQQSARYRTLSWEPRGGSPGTAREHEELFGACMRRDIDEAVRLATLHIRTTFDAVEGQLNAPDATAPRAPRRKAHTAG
jgi:DNA-binding GntR family transcriptional regulator